jgi:hypothetical protein
MALTITGQKITSDRTEHWAECRGWWSVSWMPRKRLTREDAILAMNLTEALQRYLPPDSAERQECTVWAARLGFTFDEAWHCISLPLDPGHAELALRSRQREADFDFEAG